MALSESEMMDLVDNWAAQHQATVDPSGRSRLGDLFANEAVPRIRDRLDRGHPRDVVSKDVDAAIYGLLSASVVDAIKRIVNAIGINHALLKLCPGFWPFC